MDRHAYLIMAHGNFGILEKLLKLLDDVGNDIYIHIDKKVKDFDFALFSSLCRNANVAFTAKRINVKWGAASFVDAEMLLFSTAAKETHSYYHLISGVDLPLKTQNEIHSLLCNDSREYINIKSVYSQYDYERLSIYHPSKGLEAHISAALCGIQRRFKTDRIKKYGYVYCRGANWCSLTHDAVLYLLENKRFIRKITRYADCADEVYKQFILFNSPFKERIYRDSDNKTDDLREIDWVHRVKNSPHIYTQSDYEILIKSDKLFARKFDEKVDPVIIDRIFEYVIEKKNSESGNCDGV